MKRYILEILIVQSKNFITTFREERKRLADCPHRATLFGELPDVGSTNCIHMVRGAAIKAET